MWFSMEGVVGRRNLNWAMGPPMFSQRDPQGPIIFKEVSGELVGMYGQSKHESPA